MKSFRGKMELSPTKKVEKRKELPPLLFNLSNLQGYITNKYNGWTAGKVLKFAQSLYEKKFITYPRTSSLALEESLTGKTKKVLDALSVNLSYRSSIKFSKSKRIFNNAKVESHSAITPTYKLPKRLGADEKIVYETIKNRFIMQFMPPALYEETMLQTTVPEAGVKGVFVSKGKVLLEAGWKQVESIPATDKHLPYVEESEQTQLIKADISKHETKPPKRHTEKTLLKIMETCGRSFKEEDSAAMMESIMAGFSIGTAATRAETIAKLKTAGYIAADGKHLTCTDTGKKLVEMFPVPSLFDLEFTGRLEKTLADIEKGRVKKSAFMTLISDFTRSAVDQIKQDQDAVIRTVTKQSGTKRGKAFEVLGKCPACGGYHN
ncbi:DNA topoisomerase [Virgibacillus halophilus]|uniref:DNA topoisomerase n=1 Tax=Tigheibacillus halophilus TaxID=361280 RepID=A0ABU5CBF7_9BACI|nr:DNA topoisomerase [Virgibacillus halophilus]